MAAAGSSSGRESRRSRESLRMPRRMAQSGSKPRSVRAIRDRVAVMASLVCGGYSRGKGVVGLMSGFVAAWAQTTILTTSFPSRGDFAPKAGENRDCTGLMARLKPHPQGVGLPCRNLNYECCPGSRLSSRLIRTSQAQPLPIMSAIKCQHRASHQSKSACGHEPAAKPLELALALPVHPVRFFLPDPA